MSACTCYSRGGGAFIVTGVGYLSGRRRQGNPDWPGYLADFHDERPGVTERLLARVVAGNNAPYPWLAEPLADVSGPVLDLACGSAPTHPFLTGARWFGADTSAGELAAAATAGRGPLVRASADALPVAGRAVDAVCAAMCLPVLTPLDAVLAEAARVLRPGGRVAALVPSRLVPVRGWWGWWRVLRALGVRSQPWPNPRARDGLATILRAHGFVVDSDERRVYRLELADPETVALLVDGLYLPGADPDRTRAGKRTLASWARPGRWLPLPLRRVVAHLPKE